VYEQIIERILIIKLGALGDVLRTTTCLEPLKRRYPASHITWVTRANARELLEDNPAIDRLLFIEENYLELLLTEWFDLAINPDTDAVSSAIMGLVRADTKQGFTADGRGGVTPLSGSARDWWLTGIDDQRKRANRRTYGQWLYAICDVPTPIARPYLPPSTTVAAQVAHTIRSASPHHERLIGFNTGAGTRWAEKQWKPDYFIKLAEMIEASDPYCGIILTGGPDEETFNRDLRRAHPAFIDGGSNNSVVEFASLIAECDWILTADSFGYHVACAMGTPALCLVGPTSPWELDAYDTNCVLYPRLDCIACYRAQCPLPTTCMDVLTPELVWNRARSWRSSAGERWPAPVARDVRAPDARRHASHEDVIVERV
jgi:heptosyltransferase-2